MTVEFRQIEGRDAWIYVLNVPGLAKIRFGIEVKSGFLVLSNIPWSQPLTVKTVERRELDGAAAQLAPGAVKQGLPGLFATQNEQNQLAAVKGMAALYPLLLTVSATPEEAAAVVFSMVADVSHGRMWVAGGNPCQTPYDEIDLTGVVHVGG